THFFPKDSDSIKASLLFNSPIVHPTVTLRKKTLEKFNLGYDSSKKSEDYDLWVRCALYKEIKFYNLPQVLLNYRVHPNQVTNKKIDDIRTHSDEVRHNYLRELGVNLNEFQLDLYNRFSRGAINFSENDF